ncbi:MAG: insulinase family protein [Deltaproteobacteria bacterium]|nr:insulinase family protein [Deltaproteobacteria bacterium]
MSRSIMHALAACIVLSCGPKTPVHEPKPAPDDEAEDVQTYVQFLETMAIPPEVLEAIAKQREKVVAQPDPLGEAEYTFPDVHSGKLKNGLAWYVVEQDGLPLVSLNLVVRAGTAHDPETLPGLSVFTGDMLREGGTTERTAAELAADIETLGADLSVITGADYTLVAVDSISDHAARLLSLMGEMVMKPAFDEKAMEMFRQREMHRLELSHSDPEWIADFVLLEQIYGKHPYSRYDTTKQALEAMTREDVLSFHETHYAARNGFFVAVGDVDLKTFGATLEKAFGSLPRGKKAKIKWPTIEAPDKRRVVVVDRPGSAQTVIRVANTTLQGSHADALPFMVANHVLGGNASSRLFMVLREEKGLTYGCYSHVPMRVDVGSFFIETSTKTPSTGESLEEIFRQIDLFTAAEDGGGVGADELEATQRYLTGVLAIKGQTASQVSDLLIDRIIYGLSGNYYGDYAKNVNAVTPDDVRTLASKYIHPETAVVVLVGDAAQIKDAASKWGEVQVITW